MVTNRFRTPSLLVLLAACGTLDEFRDADVDGHRYDAGDCDDDDPTVHPGAVELPNGGDDDCDGVADEDTPVFDDDGDGYSEQNGDCDDGDAKRRPGAAEIPDGIDQDCDLVVDEGTTRFDDDGDGRSEVDGDCDDGDALVGPDLPERSNGADDDCDGLVDDGTDRYDDDGDGQSETLGDCDDADADTFARAPEQPDGRDNDCDGATDEGTILSDDDGDGVTEADGDCDDRDLRVNPGAFERPNGLDDDCDTLVDNRTDRYDDDGDAQTESEGDCDDADPAVLRYSTETVDGKDNDCNGVVDDRTAISDDDQDGWSEDEGDCDDGAVGVHPFAPEVCDQRDNDCSGRSDDPTLLEDPHNGADDDCDGSIDEDWQLSSGHVEDDLPLTADGILDWSPDCATEEQWGGYSAFSPARTMRTRVVLLGNTTPDATARMFTEANDVFAPMGLAFSPEFTSWAEAPFALPKAGDLETLVREWTELGHDPNAEMTVFVAPNVADACGVGSPPAFTYTGILVQESCGAETLVHEIGHFLGLYHTHQGLYGAPTSNNAERVDGSNCTVAGDVLCETPADPGPQRPVQNPTGCQVNYNTCEVLSCPTEAGGATYDPDVDNIMSYYASCRTNFTEDQEKRMLCGASRYRGRMLQQGTSAPASSMRVVEDRAYLAANGGASIRLTVPEGHTCQPFVNWERVLEWGEDQCDTHSNVTQDGDEFVFDLSVEHCQSRPEVPGPAAVARATLFCNEGDNGFARSATSDRQSGAVHLPWPDAAAEHVEAICSLTGVDGNGDVDFGGGCWTDLEPDGAHTTMTWGCDGNGGETIEAQTLLLGVPADVQMRVVPFDVPSGTTEFYVHRYGASPDHLAYAIPNWVNTGCDDHGAFASECWDDGEMIQCAITVLGSIRSYSGNLLFLDGAFPDARSTRP